MCLGGSAHDDADKEDVDHLVNVDNLLMGLIDRVAVVDQDRHSAGRVDITKVLNTLDNRRLEHRERGDKVTFVSQPPLEGRLWWMNFALRPVSPRHARTCCVQYLTERL